MHQNKNQNKNKHHEPVLLSEVLKCFKPKSGESFLDLTAGYGGHAKAVTERIGSLKHTILVDRDESAVKQLRKLYGNKAAIIHEDFLSASQKLVKDKRSFDLILADLGVSSPHLNEGNRGFSINQTGPLDMRMDQSITLTADKIVNSYSQANIAKILKNFGEEPKAEKIAKYIVAARPVHSTSELADLAKKAWPGRSRIHPATRTFQALRIAVNDELNQLSSSLPLWLKLLNPGGRIAVISFHSLEDRIVKNAFKQVSGSTLDATMKLLTKHPITASPQEIEYNPRARSAKLRAAVKIKKKGNSNAY